MEIYKNFARRPTQKMEIYGLDSETTKFTIFPLFFNNFDEQEDLVTESISQLRNEGFKDSDIVLLSNFHEGCIARKLLEKKEWKNRISEFDINNKDKILYTTIGRFKGLEAPAIIITDFTSIENKQNLFYVGISRALHRLSVFLHRDMKDNINEIVTNKI